MSMFEMAKKPSVVFGRSVSLGRLAGAAAAAMPDNRNRNPTQHNAHFKNRGTAQLLVSIGAGIIYLIGKVDHEQQSLV